MKFKAYLNEAKQDSVSLATSKGPVGYLTVIKYDDGQFGLISFSMDGKGNSELVKKYGFEYSKSMNYPVKTYKTRADLDKELKNTFGVNPRLVETALSESFSSDIEAINKAIDKAIKEKNQKKLDQLQKDLEKILTKVK